MSDQKYKAVFIDKDGTLIPDIPYNVNADLIRIEPETIKGLFAIKQLGFLVIVISNQPGIAKGYFEEKDLENVKNKIQALLGQHRISIDGFYYCPHYPGAVVSSFSVDCDCRKPMPGLILKAARDLNIDIEQSWMIGDILNDVEAGKRAGCRTILIDNGNETEWIINALRVPDATAKNIAEAAAIIKENSKTALHYERLEGL